MVSGLERVRPRFVDSISEGLQKSETIALKILKKDRYLAMSCECGRLGVVSDVDDWIQKFINSISEEPKN